LGAGIAPISRRHARVRPRVAIGPPTQIHRRTTAGATARIKHLRVLTLRRVEATRRRHVRTQRRAVVTPHHRAPIQRPAVPIRHLAAAMAAEGAVITAVVVAEARMVVVAEVALMAAEGRVEAVPTVTNCSACSPPEI
jgi:hypothetical protein